MLGLARAIIADGRVSTLEARIFRAWIEHHPELRGVQAVDDLVAEMRAIFSDGQVTDEGRDRLRDLLEQLAAGA